MEASARLRNNPRTNNNSGAPRKVRLVVDQIRGLDVDKAFSILAFNNKAASKKVEQLLLCAINNWKQKHEEDPDNHELYVKAAFVDASKTMKRFQPAPHGRAHRIRKRTNHITIVVASRNAEAETATTEETQTAENE